MKIFGITIHNITYYLKVNNIKLNISYKRTVLGRKGSSPFLKN